jgi:hypothetical protein
MKTFSIPIFDLNDALRPIDAPRVLALLRLGLEEFGNNDAESTYREFCDALTEIPPG